MEQEGTFRYALLVVFAIAIGITAYHRARARAAGGSVSRREEGFALLAMRAVVGLSLWAALPSAAIIAYSVSPGSMAWSALPAADWLRWGGVGLGLLACGLLYWTLHHLGTNLTDTVDAGVRAGILVLPVSNRYPSGNPVPGTAHPNGAGDGRGGLLVDACTGGNVCGRSCDATASPTVAREVPPVERLSVRIANRARRVLAAHESTPRCPFSRLLPLRSRAPSAWSPYHGEARGGV